MHFRTYTRDPGPFQCPARATKASIAPRRRLSRTSNAACQPVHPADHGATPTVMRQPTAHLSTKHGSGRAHAHQQDAQSAGVEVEVSQGERARGARDAPSTHCAVVAGQPALLLRTPLGTLILGDLLRALWRLPVGARGSGRRRRRGGVEARHGVGAADGVVGIAREGTELISLPRTADDAAPLVFVATIDG